MPARMSPPASMAADTSRLARLRGHATWQIAPGHADVHAWAVHTRDGDLVGIVADYIADIDARRVCYLDVAHDDGRAAGDVRPWDTARPRLLVPVGNVQLDTTGERVVVDGAILEELAALVRGSRDIDVAAAVPAPPARRGAAAVSAALVVTLLAITAAAAVGRPAMATGLDVDRTHLAQCAAPVAVSSDVALAAPRAPAHAPSASTASTSVPSTSVPSAGVPLFGVSSTHMLSADGPRRRQTPAPMLLAHHRGAPTHAAGTVAPSIAPPVTQPAVLADRVAGRRVLVRKHVVVTDAVVADAAADDGRAESTGTQRRIIRPTVPAPDTLVTEPETPSPTHAVDRRTRPGRTESGRGCLHRRRACVG